MKIIKITLIIMILLVFLLKGIPIITITTSIVLANLTGNQIIFDMDVMTGVITHLLMVIVFLTMFSAVTHLELSAVRKELKLREESLKEED